MRGRILVTAVAVFALATTAASVSAAPQGPWVMPAKDVSATSLKSYEPQVATAPDGTTTAIWRSSEDGDSPFTVQAATRPPGGEFGPPEDISAPGGSAYEPQLSIAPDGTTTAIWDRYDGSHYIIQAATRPSGGDFSDPVDVSAADQDTDNPQVTTAPDGTTTVVWSIYDGNMNVQAATRPPGGSFGTPVDLSPAGDLTDSPQVATAPDGTTTAVWQQLEGGFNVVQAAVRPPGDDFGAPVELSAPDSSAWEPQISIAPDGTTTAIWYSFKDSLNTVQVATRPAGGDFGDPVDISADGEESFGARIATAPDGTTTAVWQRKDGSDYIVVAATRPPGGNFSAPVDVSTVATQSPNPRITVAPDGTATVLWKQRNGDAADIIQAATRPPGGNFGAPVDISSPGTGADPPQISSAPDGSVTAVWQRTNDIIQAISTGQPSFLLELSKAGDGSGTVTSSPAGISCGTNCSADFLFDTTVTLTATPDSGSTFNGWQGACQNATGKTCELTILDDLDATATFKSSPPPPGKAKLKITRIQPKKPRVKRGKTIKLKVTARNTGKAKATGVKLCLKLGKGVKKALKPKGKTCRKPGSLAAGKARTSVFKLKATGKVKKGRKYQVTFKLTAKKARAASRAVKVIGRGGK